MSKREITVGDRYAVIDNFFDDDQFRVAQEWARSMSGEVRDSVIDASDGRSWRSKTVAFNTNSNDAPSHLNAFVEAFKYSEVPWSAEESTSVKGAVWQYLSGSALGWHNDAGSGRIGEFVCFLHSEWGADWGGELVILDKPGHEADRTGPDGILTIPEFVEKNRTLMTLIPPVPNRVVFIKAGTAHTIKRVEDQWDSDPRLTFTGFVTNRNQSNDQRGRQLIRAFASEGA